jgi:tetratricopeptide (TPR) repeat protein
VQCAGCASRAPYRLLIAVLLGLLPPVATAQQAADASTSPQTQAPQQAYEAAIAALQAGDADRARTLLLDVVRRAPQFAGAWLDLAIATQRMGDLAQAEEFLDLIEQRFTVPPALQRAIAELRDRIRQGERLVAMASAAQQPPAGPPTASAARTRVQAQVSAGYDANANAGLSASAVSLTLPGGSISLPLAENFRPRGEGFSAAQLSWEGAFEPLAAVLKGAARAEVGASVRSLAYRREHAFSTDELQISAALNWPGPWRLSAQAQHLRLGGVPLLSSAGGALRRAWPAAPCQPLALFELDRRRFENSPNLDSRLLWAGLQGNCPMQGGGVVWQLRMGHEVGLTAPDPDSGARTARPGGATLHREVALLHRRVLPGLPGPWKQSQPPRLEALLQSTHSQDTDPYSPLLADNAKRQVRRVTVGLTLAVPLGRTAAFTVSSQAYRQVSNLEIFGLGGRLFMMNLQKQW